MKTAFIIFDQMTSLDLIGVYDPLTRLKSMNFMPNFEWDFCSLTADICDDKGLQFTADKIANPLNEYDHIVVPGGFGTRELQHNHNFLDWLKTATSVKLKSSVFTGSLLLGSAGFLKDKKATTHPNAFEQLKPYCAQVLDQ